MSKVGKAIGKVFKKVVKVVKKIALPALAIGAVVLTGGAALGALPSVGSVLGSLGIKGALTGILTTAAKTAALGAGGALLTGGNPIKGATTGFLAGGVMGGLGAAMGGAGKVAQTAASVGGSAGTTALQSNVAEPSFANNNSTYTPSTISAMDAMSMPSPVLPAQIPDVGSFTDLAQTTTGGGLGLGSMFAGMDPTTKGMMIQGLGSGLMGAMAAKEQRKAQEREWARLDANYDNLGPLFQQDPLQAQAAASAGKFYQNKIFPIKYDPETKVITRAA